MLSFRNIFAAAILSMAILMSAVTLMSCSSESAETQQLYTDAKEMMEEVNRAFMLPKSDERTQEMYKFINEEWDKKIVDKLELYLSESPNGKYAKEATSLLEEARKSQQLRGLGQMRSIAGQMGLPQNQAEVDSVQAKAKEMVDSLRDTTNSGN